MSTITNPSELRRRAIDVLVKELGYTDAMRFLLQCESGNGNYTSDRETLLPSLTDEELLSRSRDVTALAARHGFSTTPPPPAGP